MVFLFMKKSKSRFSEAAGEGKQNAIQIIAVRSQSCSKNGELLCVLEKGDNQIHEDSD